MKLRYETSVATIVQLIVMLALNFVNQLVAIITSCVKHDNCVENTVVNLLFVIVLAVWLVSLASLGYAAENRRSKRLATLLILAEALVAIVTLFNIKHFPNILGLVTSIIDFCLAVWVIILAYRLRQVEEKGVAAPTGQRPRRRVRAKAK
ncbi:MAG TPA: hypothetical protein VFH39_00650 [Candidatus Saccharimonadales bacterium]|nr:hypothetical protein [Candidatus Saccharimonadales bacterium]